jgi:hypothetical protein
MCEDDGCSSFSAPRANAASFLKFATLSAKSNIMMCSGILYHRFILLIISQGKSNFAGTYVSFDFGLGSTMRPVESVRMVSIPSSFKWDCRRPEGL